MQARSVIIQDNWQVVPLYKKSWWSMGGEVQLRRRSCLVITSMKNTGETTRSSALSTHFFKNFESSYNSLLVFLPSVGFSKIFFPQKWRFGLPPPKDRHCLHPKSGKPSRLQPR